MTADRLSREIARVGRQIDAHAAKVKRERERAAKVQPKRDPYRGKLGCKPKFTVDELRAIREEMSTLGHNRYDALHDARMSVVTKLDAYFKPEER